MPRDRHFRSSPRPHLTHQVTLRIPDDSEGGTCVATTRDISTGGMFLYTDKPFNVGNIVEVDLATPSTWEPLTLRAKVLRIVPKGEGMPGIGIQFVDLTDSQLVALIHLTTSLDFES